ncbi:MAG: hypothetical protein M0001_01850 [Treponema sp.]|nr:hypothetical protein [Treponema sp.]
MEIDIALDSYDDLFSDFDIRGYGERALSKDLLDELHIRLRRFGAKSGQEIVFLVPGSLRNVYDEELINMRLRSFFEERHDYHLREDKTAKLKSLLFVTAGLALSVAANIIVEHFTFLPIFNDFVLIPSWFFVWTGFDMLITNRREITVKKRYYATLASCRTSFRDIEIYAGANEGGPAPGGGAGGPGGGAPAPGGDAGGRVARARAGEGA